MITIKLNFIKIKIDQLFFSFCAMLTVKKIIQIRPVVYDWKIFFCSFTFTQIQFRQVSHVINNCIFAFSSFYMGKKKSFIEMHICRYIICRCDSFVKRWNVSTGRCQYNKCWFLSYLCTQRILFLLFSSSVYTYLNFSLKNFVLQLLAHGMV